MKTLVVTLLVALAGCATTKPLTATSAQSTRLTTEYQQCVFERAGRLVSTKEPARDVALTAVGVCRTRLLALADAVEAENVPNPDRQVFAHQYANTLRERTLNEAADRVMQARAK